MPKVKMWGVMTGDTISSYQIYTFESAAKKVRDKYNDIVKRDGMKWRYRIVRVTVTWVKPAPAKGEGR